MCGRFTLIDSIDLIQNQFGIQDVQIEIFPNYNVAPQTNIPVIVSHESKRTLKPLQWGLIPFWAKDGKIANKLINARSETILEKPSFKHAFKKRRCIIPASGFYEWKKTKTGKEPVYIQLESKSIMAMAGIYETWKSPDGEIKETCSILTTDPNDTLKEVHNRMPVILPEEIIDDYLNSEDIDLVHSFCVPCSFEPIVYYAVSAFVNSPKNNSPECINPV